MPYSSFSELKASIADTLDRTDLTATIPDFITKAEAVLNRELRHFKMIDRDDATLDTRFLPVSYTHLRAHETS